MNRQIFRKLSPGTRVVYSNPELHQHAQGTVAPEAFDGWLGLWVEFDLQPGESQEDRVGVIAEKEWHLLQVLGQ